MRTAKMAVPQFAVGWRRPPYFGVCDVPKGHVLAQACFGLRRLAAAFPAEASFGGTKTAKGQSILPLRPKAATIRIHPPYGGKAGLSCQILCLVRVRGWLDSLIRPHRSGRRPVRASCDPSWPDWRRLHKWSARKSRRV